MAQNQSNQKNKLWKSVITLISIVCLIACISVLFPQVRQMIIHLAERIMHKEIFFSQIWFKTLTSYALGGIFVILFFDYCMLTNSGRMLVEKVKQEFKDCLIEIDFRSLLKPVLFLSAVYLLGIFTIIRANQLYMDDISSAITGSRDWYNWSRYLIVFFSYIVQPEIRLTDISPLPYLLAVPVLSLSSVLLVYVIGNKKITIVRLLASIPLGLSPYALESLSYRYVPAYGALAILATIVPFLFIARKKAFFFCSVISLLIVCMIYQIKVNIYMLIVVILCFQAWNNREKSKKEILFFIGSAAVAFCFALLFFKFFLMIPRVDVYTATATLPFSSILTGLLSNIKHYALIVNHDFGLIWKIGVALVLLFFIIKSVQESKQRKIFSLIVSFVVIGVSFILSYGLYSFLATPVYHPRALTGFGVLLSILCIIVVSDYKKIASVVVIALNWCFFIFAFSYGNALADQGRYSEFRIEILLHDLSVLYPDQNGEGLKFQLKNTIDYAPSIKNIAKNYPLIERLVPKRLGGEDYWDQQYILNHFNYDPIKTDYNNSSEDFSSLNLPVVLDSYYHTIQSDGSHVLIILKH